MSSTSPKSAEKILLEKAANGDEESFRFLYDRYRNKIYSLSMYLTHSEYISEEITQEVFFRIWENRAKLAGIDFFVSYLKTIASNIAFNYLKRIANEKIVLKGILNEMEGYENSTENTIGFNEYQSILHKAIMNLPPQQRKVYILNRLKGVKMDDIAVEMNLSPYTVREYIKTATQSVRRYVGEKIEFTIIIAIQLFLKD